MTTAVQGWCLHPQRGREDRDSCWRTGTRRVISRWGVPCRCPRGCHKVAHPFFFLLWHPLSDVRWLPTNRHRLHTNRHRLHTNCHGLPTNRHRLPTNRHRLHTNRHRLPAAIVGRIGHSEFFFFPLWHPLRCPLCPCPATWPNATAHAPPPPPRYQCPCPNTTTAPAATTWAPESPYPSPQMSQWAPPRT